MAKVALEQLRSMTTVVSDTGDFNAIKEFKPQDATTNPSLIAAAAQMPEYSDIVDGTLKDARTQLGESADEKKVANLAFKQLAVEFGKRILKIVPGRVSTEVDARLSYDTQKSIETAHEIIASYEKAGVSRERILIKLASTWEGIRAAEQLQKEGIHCNMTLLFSLAQAAACAEAGAQLISPFVGRIYDWYKKNAGSAWDEAKDGGANDPGVHSVRRIYAYYKKFGYKTEVMGASFRTPGQVLELAGCDLLTISPDLLQKLQDSTGKVERKLSPELGQSGSIERVPVDESSFRFLVNDEAMATEKLAEGIRAFAADAVKLEKLIEELR